MKTLFLKVAILLSVVSLQSPAEAAFGKKQPSINGTGETLSQGSAELGFLSFSYGVTDQLMLSIPTLPLLRGLTSVSGRYKIELGNNMRFSPTASVYHVSQTGMDSALGAGGGFILGFDFGKSETKDENNNNIKSVQAKQSSYNSIDFGATLLSTKYSLLSLQVGDSEKDISFRLTQVAGQLEFNHYTEAGNLFYVGGSNSLGPYVGFTWGFKNTHFGFMSSALSALIPLPYLYWRL